MSTPIASTMTPPSVTTTSEERSETCRKRCRTQAIVSSSITTTIPATISARLTLEMMNGNEWKTPPSAVAPPVIVPRTKKLPGTLRKR